MRRSRTRAPAPPRSRRAIGSGGAASGPPASLPPGAAGLRPRAPRCPPRPTAMPGTPSSRRPSAVQDAETHPAADRTPVPALVDPPEAAEIRAPVRGQVAGGIADLVEELLGHGGARYPAARARVLGHHEAAVGRPLGDRIADVERRHLPPVGQVAA